MHFAILIYDEPDSAVLRDQYRWMVRWGLISSSACTANLVDNRLTETVATPTGDESRAAYVGAEPQPARYPPG